MTDQTTHSAENADHVTPRPEAPISDAGITYEVQMPEMIGEDTAGRIARWHVSEGQSIKPGDIIADISSDRATIEVEAQDAGQVIKLIYSAGSEPVASGTPIAIVSTGQNNGGTQTTPDIEKPTEAKLKSQTHPKETSTFELPHPRSPEADNDIPLKNITVRVALREALKEEMDRDESVFVLGEGVADDESTYKVTYGLKSRFGERRVCNMPVTEAGFTGLSVGAALAGLKPVVEFQHWSLALQAVDQIVNTASKMRYLSAGRLNVPVVFRGPNGAASRVGAQQGQNFAAWLASVPGLVVVAPATASDSKGLLKQAIRSADPVIILETERLYGRVGPVPDVTDHLCPFGSASVVKSGTTVSLVTYSAGVALCLEAANRLTEEGIDAEVIDLRSLRPLDEDTIFESVRKTKRLITIEEAWPSCSIGSEIASRVMAACFDSLDAPPTRVTGADIPLPYAANLEKLALPSASDIVAAAKKVCYL